MKQDAERYTRTGLLRIAGEPTRLRVRTITLTRLGAQAADHHFAGELVRIGSAPEADLVVHDPSVSGAHCRIFLEGGRFVIQDERSKNGTFVNDVPIREAFLLPGMRVTVGGAVFRFETDERDEAVQPSKKARLGELVGTSASMREAFGLIARIAPVDSTVVITGETGTGKELAARALHDLSSRSEGPFTVVDCGAISPTLIGSELFGHERGAFTGALERKIGSFERAHGGTVFLDEIGELPLDMQVRLLRVLERHEIKRVGGERYLPIDVRVVAATHRDLEAMVAEGTLRQDLLFRLDVVSITMPPLRERKEDIALLLRHFLRNARFNIGPDGERKVSHVSPLAMRALSSHAWPGNVRELKHAIERAVGLGEGDTITIGDLPPRLVSPELAKAEREASGTFKEAKRAWVDAFASDYLARLLERHDGDVNAAAAEADLHPKYMRQLMMQYEIGPYAD